MYGQSQVLIIALKTLAIEPLNTPLCLTRKEKRKEKNFFVLSPSGLVAETRCFSVAILKPFQKCLTGHIN